MTVSECGLHCLAVEHDEVQHLATQIARLSTMKYGILATPIAWPYGNDEVQHSGNADRAVENDEVQHSGNADRAVERDEVQHSCNADRPPVWQR